MYQYAVGKVEHLPDIQMVRLSEKMTLLFGSKTIISPQQNLGYEKYASAFEDAKIGLLELPYLPEERVEQLGVPMGPRMRILQEAKATIGNDHSMNVYIL